MQEIKKRLILKEDINFDYVGTNETESFFGPDGKNYQGTKFNASHLPLTKEGREKLASANVDQALINLTDKFNGFSAGDALTEDIEIEINAEDTPDVIQDKINQQKKNLNGHTITFNFPDLLSQQLYSTLVWQDFYNGTIKILGGSGENRVPVYDKLDITSLFKIYRCQCEVIIRYFNFVHQYSLYAISAESSSAVMVEKCNISGIPGRDSYAVNKSAANVILLDCELSKDIEFYPPENGIGKHLGEIFAYPGVVPPEGAYLLNGQTIAGCNELYPKFWDWVQTSGVRSIDNATFEAELASTGVCGGFVVDATAGSVRLPSVMQGTLWGADSATVGRSLAAGLPNITGDIGNKVNFYTAADTGNGALYANQMMSATAIGGGTGFFGNIGFNASLSNSIYGKSDTVQPPAIRVSWCIQVFNAATALSEQESVQLASEMQTKQAISTVANAAFDVDWDNRVPILAKNTEYQTSKAGILVAFVFNATTTNGTLALDAYPESYVKYSTIQSGITLPPTAAFGANLIVPAGWRYIIREGEGGEITLHSAFFVPFKNTTAI